MRRILPSLSTAARWCSSAASTASTSSTSSTSSSPGMGTTHFGFQSIPEFAKENMVKGVFDSVSSKYDIMNDVMSGGLHRCWKDRMVTILNPRPGQKFLDVAGGTGDISFRIEDLVDQAAGRLTPGSFEATEITLTDINISMLEEAERRYKERPHPRHAEIRMTIKDANAESLPFDDNAFDKYTIAFGIRNVTHIDKALAEAFRVLKPGGQLVVLEFSNVENPLLKTAYDTYSMNVIPVMGHVIANDWNSYQYLVESIRRFPPQEQFADMIRDAGFRAVSYESLTFGVVAIHSGWKLQ